MDVFETQIVGFLSFDLCPDMRFNLRSTFATEFTGECIVGLSQCAWNDGVAV